MSIGQDRLGVGINQELDRCLSEDVVVPSNVSLIQLPPYSPELNPVENLWHYLRAHHWSNRRDRDYDALQEEAVRSLCAVREDTETIKTVCNAPYISRVHEIAGKRMRRRCQRSGSSGVLSSSATGVPGTSYSTPRSSGPGSQGALPRLMRLLRLMESG